MENGRQPLQVFIGSSAEGLGEAEQVQRKLEDLGIQVNRWDQGTFTLSSWILQDLIEMSGRVDFAIMVATSDDVVISRDKEAPAIRDNILFEYGLFIGAIGLERSLLLKTGDAKIPSDLNGLVYQSYEKPKDQDTQANLDKVIKNIHDHMVSLGAYVRTPSQQSTSEKSLKAIADRVNLTKKIVFSSGEIEHITAQVKSNLFK